MWAKYLNWKNVNNVNGLFKIINFQNCLTVKRNFKQGFDKIALFRDYSWWYFCVFSSFNPMTRVYGRKSWWFSIFLKSSTAESSSRWNRQGNRIFSSNSKLKSITTHTLHVGKRNSTHSLTLMRSSWKTQFHFWSVGHAKVDWSGHSSRENGKRYELFSPPPTLQPRKANYSTNFHPLLVAVKYCGDDSFCYSLYWNAISVQNTLCEIAICRKVLLREKLSVKSCCPFDRILSSSRNSFLFQSQPDMGGTKKPDVSDAETSTDWNDLAFIHSP